MFAELDDSGDGEVSQDEFVEGCMQDEDLVRMLSENWTKYKYYVQVVMSTKALHFWKF